MMKFIFDRTENIVEIGENAGDQHFLIFQNLWLVELLKFGIAW